MSKLDSRWPYVISFFCFVKDSRLSSIMYVIASIRISFLLQVRALYDWLLHILLISSSVAPMDIWVVFIFGGYYGQ